MKTYSLIKSILLCAALTLIFDSCRKAPINADESSDPTTIAAIEGMRTAYNMATVYNDSLNYWYNLDSALYKEKMNHCDDRYHSYNSVMMNNYNIMNSSGGMTSENSTNGGMMSGCRNCGSMMRENKATVNCNINGVNSTTMINALHQSHIHHPSN